MAIPVLESDWTATIESGLTTSHTATMPAGVTSGELLVIVCCWDITASGAGPQFADDLTGWDFEGQGGSSTSDSWIGVYTKIATGSDSNEEVTTAESGESVVYCMRFSGVDGTTPINTSAFLTQGANTTSHVIPQVTTSVDDCYILYALSYHGIDGDPLSPSAGFTEEDEGGQASFLGSACFGYKTSGQPTAGATGACTVTSTGSDGSAGVMLAIAPGAADSTAPILTTVTSTAVTQATATVGCTTDEDNGDLYAVATTSTTSPTKAQVKAGQDHTGSAAVWSDSQAISTTGAKTFSAADTLVPGTTYYLHYMHEDDAANQSTVLTDSTGITMLSAFAGSATSVGATIPANSIHYITSGTQTAADDATDDTLTDSAASFVVGHIGLRVNNNTDGSTGSVLTVPSGTTLTTSLSGGSDNSFDQNDAYNLEVAVDTDDITYHETTTTVSSESASFDYYVYDNSAGTYSAVVTVTITASGASDGSYTVALDTEGVPTLTPISSGSNSGDLKSYMHWPMQSGDWMMVDVGPWES